MKGSKEIDTLGFVAGGTAVAASGVSVSLGIVPNPISTGADIISVISTVLKSTADYLKAARPSSFTSLTFDMETPIFEDKNIPESVWNNAEAYVISESFSFSRSLGEILYAQAGTVPVAGWGFTAVGLGFDKQVGELFDSLEGDGDYIPCITVEAQQWGPFDVTPGTWTESTVLGNTISKINHNTYVPASIGQSQLQVKILPDEFGGNFITAEEYVNVKRKEVLIAPAQALVENPGDSVEFSVSILAHHPEDYALDYNPDLLEVIGFTDNGDGSYLVTLKTSPDAKVADFPMLFRVKSTSSEVPPAEPLRQFDARISLDSSIEILPPPSCVSPGQAIDLEAVLGGFENQDNQTVSWSATGGNVSVGTPTRMAVFTSNTIGNFTITAETPARNTTLPDLSGNVNVQVSNLCVRQYITADISSDADGDPDCDGPYNNRDDIGQEATSIQTLGAVGELNIPTPQGAYYQDESFSLLTDSNFDSSEELLIVDGADAECRATHPSAKGEINITTSSASASWDARTEDSGTCIDTVNGPFCNMGTSAYVVDHYMYIPITEAGVWEMSVTLNCSLFPHYGFLVNIGRWKDGTTFDLPNGSASQPTPENPNPSVPWIAPQQSMAFSCGTEQTKTLTLDLAGPLGTGGDDLVTIWYTACPYCGLGFNELAENGAVVDPVGKGGSPLFIHSVDVQVSIQKLN